MSEIVPKIEEVAGHFDKIQIKPKISYSLHTKYSWGKRKFNSALMQRFQIIRESQKKSVPQLWRNGEWSLEFSSYLKNLVNDNIPPKIIEVHPPFCDYCDSIELFLENYEIFETE